MAREFFLSPASKKSQKGPYHRLKRTVVSGFSPSELSQYTDVRLSDPVRIWGFREGKKSFWQQMDREDVILFYTGDEYEYSAQIWTTERNKELAEEIWGRLVKSLGGDLQGDLEPWPYLVFLGKLRELSLPSAHLHDLLEYKQDHIVGTTRVVDRRMRGVEQEYGSMAALIVKYTEKEYF